MNNEQDINKLFEAARRREADLRRQQQLGAMIDWLAESEEMKAEKGKRKAGVALFWTYAGIAASVLLLATLGMHILLPDSTSPSMQPLIAEETPMINNTNTLTKTESETNTKTKTESETKTNTELESELESVVPVHKPHQSTTLAQSETPVDVPLLELQKSNIEEKVSHFEPPVVQADHPLVAEALPENGGEKTVYERTSTRLVCGSGCRPQVRPSQEDSPRFAFTNISSTGTTIGLGASAF